MMTEAQYLEKLPFLAEWPSDYRARFTVAANDLNYREIWGDHARHLAALVGVIVLRHTGKDDAKIIPRDAAVKMVREAGAPAEVWGAISGEPRPNCFTILCVTPGAVVAFEIPVIVHRCTSSGLQ